MMRFHKYKVTVAQGALLAIIAYCYDSLLPPVATITIAVILVLFLAFKIYFLEAICMVMMMGVSNIVAYLFSCSGIGTSYVTADLILRTLGNLILLVAHDGPYGEERASFRASITRSLTNITLSYTLFHWKSLIHYLPDCLHIATSIIYLSICARITAFILYSLVPNRLVWLFSVRNGLRRLNDKRELFWLHVFRWLRGALQQATERIKRNYDLPFYSYEGLSQGQIRLLHVKRRLPFSGPLKVEVIEFKLDDAPPYEAISYTWGDPTPKHEILMNGRRFSVTDTIYALLHSRSSLWHERLLWIDFICVNQEDKAEKEGQIPLMRNIYTEATRVIAWLDDPPEAPMAAAMVEEVYADLVTHNFSTTHLLNTYAVHANNPRWRTFTRLFHHPYFSRIWICQEIAVASKIQLYYGGRYIPWDDLMQVLSACTHPHIRVYFNMTGLKEFKFDHFDGCQNSIVLSFFRNQVAKKLPLSLGMILSMSSAFKSTLPEDRIFGLLGLAADNDEIFIIPDYSKPAATIYTEVAEKLLLSKTDTMLVLPYAGIGYPRNFAELPSWVPDWSRRQVGRIFSIHLPIEIIGLATAASNTTNAEHSPNSLKYSAANDSSQQVRMGPTPRTFQIKCILVDVITTLNTAFDTPTSTGDISHGMNNLKETYLWHLAAKRLVQESEGRHPYGTDVLRGQAFWRALIGDRSQECFPAPPIYQEYYDLWCDLTSAGLYGPESGAGSFAELAEKYKPLITRTFSDAAAEWGIKFAYGYTRLYCEFDTRFQEAAMGRRFCLSSDGYMGLVPPGAQVGDLICIVLGAQVPFLLRPFHEHDEECPSSVNFYQLVGECFMQGMMRGEKMGSGPVEVYTLV